MHHRQISLALVFFFSSLLSACNANSTPPDQRPLPDQGIYPDLHEKAH